MKMEEVIEYLEATPQFFEQCADRLAEIFVPHPHGGRAISLSERQMLTLRDKNQKLEQRLRELISFGEENDVISEKMHRLAVGLVAAETFPAALHLVHLHLRDDFAIPRVALRLWRKPGNVANLPEFAAVSADLQDFAEQLEKPYCGASASLDDAAGVATSAWFGAYAVHIRSQALVALRNGGGAIGLLALGSEDAERFYSGMGTLYLERLGEIISAVLGRVTHSAL
ncbi:MAG: DUF484 family protein [Zoogloeaceae bacterium]|jgi:uncharacterized protein YigA (DUF484 family)|nr:DUF484 family protein [Zoogloeaceae bacterium]